MRAPQTQDVSAAPSSLSVAQCQELEALLGQYIAHHEELVRVAKEHRDAIARADVAGMARSTARHQEAGKRFLDLESQRKHLLACVGGRAYMVRAAGQPQLTLSSIAQRAAEPARSRLLSLACRLRELVTAAGEHHRVLRSVSESLLGHMQGLMAQVRRSLSPNGVYCRPGSGESAGQVISALDLTS